MLASVYLFSLVKIKHINQSNCLFYYLGHSQLGALRKRLVYVHKHALGKHDMAIWSPTKILHALPAMLWMCIFGINYIYIGILTFGRQLW